jgi:hypothetical protein
MAGWVLYRDGDIYFQMDAAPKVAPLIDGELWELTEDFEVNIQEYSFVVPKGFVTDGASIPRFFWRLCGHPLEATRFPAAIVHDFLYYEDTGVDRKTADELYRKMLIALGESKFAARVEWIALRCFGWRRWNSHEP